MYVCMSVCMFAMQSSLVKLVRMVDNPVYQDGRQTCQDGR